MFDGFQVLLIWEPCRDRNGFFENFVQLLQFNCQLSNVVFSKGDFLSLEIVVVFSANHVQNFSLFFLPVFLQMSNEAFRTKFFSASQIYLVIRLLAI